MTHDKIMKNHPGALQGKFSNKKVVWMLEIQNDTNGHGALRLYISKIFLKVTLHFSCSKHDWSKLCTVNDMWAPFLEGSDDLIGVEPYFKIKTERTAEQILVP